jgi:hypothetical protein
LTSDYKAFKLLPLHGNESKGPWYEAVSLVTTVEIKINEIIDAFNTKHAEENISLSHIDIDCEYKNFNEDYDLMMSSIESNPNIRENVSKKEINELKASLSAAVSVLSTGIDKLQIHVIHAAYCDIDGFPYLDFFYNSGSNCERTAWEYVSLFAGKFFLAFFIRYKQ